MAAKVAVNGLARPVGVGGPHQIALEPPVAPVHLEQVGSAFLDDCVRPGPCRAQPGVSHARHGQRDAVVDAGIHDVDGAEDVGLDGWAWVLDRLRRSEDGSEVDDSLYVGDRLHDGYPVPDVEQVPRSFQVPVAHYGVVPLRPELVTHPAADESVAPSHQYPHLPSLD